MSSAAELSFLLVEIAGQLVACDVRAVQAVLPMDDVVAVPLAPPSVAGITTKRGHVLTVIDGRAPILSSPPPATRESVVVDISGYRYALLVDAIDEVVSVAPGDIESPPPGIEDVWARFTTGMIRIRDGRLALIVRLEHFVENSGTQAAGFNHNITSAALEPATVH